MSLRAGLVTKKVIFAAVALWAPLVAFGTSVLWRYSTTPGRAATPPGQWPAGAPIARRRGRPALLMFAHPECECSRASLGELAILLADSGGKLDATVLFSVPASLESAWSNTPLWSQARAIPGVQVLEDRDSRVAQRFGAYTSGQTFLYDGGGRLLFKGGITTYRGHSGDNAGRSVMTALLQQRIPQPALPIATPVFGCSLRGE